MYDAGARDRAAATPFTSAATVAENVGNSSGSRARAHRAPTRARARRAARTCAAAPFVVRARPRRTAARPSPRSRAARARVWTISARLRGRGSSSGIAHAPSRSNKSRWIRADHSSPSAPRTSPPALSISAFTRPGMRRQQQDPVADADRLRDRMRDEQHRELRVVPEPQQLVLHLARASARRARRTARPSAAPAAPSPARARSPRAASCRPIAYAGSCPRSRVRPTFAM